MRLPPPGSDATQIAEFVDLVVQEASKDGRRLQWEYEAQRGTDLFMGDHFQTEAPADRIRIVINRVLNCVMAQFAIQAGDPPRITFKPRASGAPPQVFLNTLLPESQKLLKLFSGTPGPDGAARDLDPAKPLPDDVVEKIRAEIEAGERLKATYAAQGLPSPVTLPAAVLTEVSRQTAAERAQTVFDCLWESADLQYAFAENVFLKNTLGVQSTLYEFDDEAKRPVCTNVAMKQLFLDPLQSDQNRCGYTIYDEPVDVDEGMARYPDLAAEISENAVSGGLQWSGSQGYQHSQRFNRPFNRDYVAIRHAYFRNQPYPLTPDEAIERGKVLEGNEPTDGNSTCPGCKAEYNAEAAGQPCPDCGASIEPAVRKFLSHPETGEELTPMIAHPDDAEKQIRNPKWPVRYSVRQIRIIANRCVDDRECEAGDIPFPTNTNIMVPYSPYGMGEPWRLEGMQMAVNHTISSIVTHGRYNAYPPEFIAQDLLDRLGDAVKKMRTQPGDVIGIPRDLLDLVQGDVRKLVASPETPAMPADFWKLLDFLIQMIDKEGNLADVMQGNAAAGWSGEAIASLQNAASQVIKAKSMSTEFYLRRLARLVYHSMVTRLTPEDWADMCGDAPLPAMKAIFEMHQKIDFDLAVSITSGSGSSRQAETNNLVAAKQAGLPISAQTVMERLNIDPDLEFQRNAEAARKQQALTPQQITPAQPGPPVVGSPAQEAGQPA